MAHARRARCRLPCWRLRAAEPGQSGATILGGWARDGTRTERRPALLRPGRAPALGSAGDQQTRYAKRPSRSCLPLWRVREARSSSDQPGPTFALTAGGAVGPQTPAPGSTSTKWRPKSRRGRGPECRLARHLSWRKKRKSVAGKVQRQPSQDYVFTCTTSSLSNFPETTNVKGRSISSTGYPHHTHGVQLKI